MTAIQGRTGWGCAVTPGTDAFGLQMGTVPGEGGWGTCQRTQVWLMFTENRKSDPAGRVRGQVRQTMVAEDYQLIMLPVMINDQFENAANFQNSPPPQLQTLGKYFTNHFRFRSSNENLGAQIFIPQPAVEKFFFGRDAKIMKFFYEIFMKFLARFF